MSLVVIDEYIDSVKAYFMTQCEDINNIKNSYVRAMGKLIETGIMEGSTAEALKVFLEKIQCDLGNNTETPQLMSSKVERLCLDFSAKIDKADKQLY